VKEKLTAIGNAVVWIDELEKCLPKAGDRNLDGGTSDALLQGILNWTQERKGGIYLVATANDVSALPPELLRKGRWDAIFFVDLPTQEEREEIFRIHLRKRGRELSDDSVRYLAKATDGYSGAEIEAGVVDGLWAAFGDGKRALRQEDIYDCMMLDIPLSKMMEDQVARLRAFAEKGARPASQKKAAQVQQATTIIPIRKIKMGKQGVEDGTPD
jgi:SpoVK/Ycf46/Vps4 family AAA+-type ATPase